MRKIILIIAISILPILAVKSESIDYKFGKISDYELKMNVYDKDSTAEAVVIIDEGYTTYEWRNDDFVVMNQMNKRIKILKKEGVDRGTISIPYYFKSNSNSESISGLTGFTYNLENGKIVKTKLDKQYIFDEEVNSSYRQIKFSLQNVKVGSVIEFKYTRTSKNAYSLPEWIVQTNIPVMHSLFEVIIPEYFIYNIETKGFETIDVKDEQKVQQFTIGYSNSGLNTVTSNSRNLIFKANDIPALKDEPYVWCKQDFNSGVRFELQGTRFPNSLYKPYFQSWENLEETLKKETDFGLNIKQSNPYKDELNTLVASENNELNKIEKIYSFVKSHISWNDTYAFYGNQAKDAVKNKTGNNSQFNMILLSALRNNGIKAYPVLLSRRSEGRLPYTYPSFEKLNTFIVAAQTTEGKVYYMDGSATFGGLNMLPIDLLVDRARVFDDGIAEKWVDLTKIAKNQLVYLIKSKLNNNGDLTGVINSGFSNQFAYSYKSKFYSAKDSSEFVENFANDAHFKVDNILITGKDTMSNSVNEVINFTKDLGETSDIIYINPLIILHVDKNPFTESNRKLPIEFNFPYGIFIKSEIELPANYIVEELPKSIKISLPDNVAKCIYQVVQKDNILEINYKFDLTQTIYPQTSYSAIMDFYTQVALKNSEMIVLKKI